MSFILPVRFYVENGDSMSCGVISWFQRREHGFLATTVSIIFKRAGYKLDQLVGKSVYQFDWTDETKTADVTTDASMVRKLGLLGKVSAVVGDMFVTIEIDLDWASNNLVGLSR